MNSAGHQTISPFKALSVVTTCTIIVAFASVLLQAYLEAQTLGRITTLASNLVRLEHDVTVQVRRRPSDLAPRVAVAYGSCNDVYVNVADFLNYTQLEAAAAAGDEPNDALQMTDISNEQELLRSFAYYFARGAAAERYTSNRTLFRALVQQLTERGPSRSDLGGNAPVMGKRFHLEGADVLIGAQMTAKLREQLPGDIRVVGPAVDYDDVHLIIEYKTNDRWGPHTAPRANRYILHNDYNNPTLSALEAFGVAVLPFAPRLFVVSGLQMMDSSPFAGAHRRASRLRDVGAQMVAVSAGGGALVHVELASFVETAFVRELFAEVLPFADSLGMNEQELAALVHFTRFGRVSQASESNPRVGGTLDAMRTLFGDLREREERRRERTTDDEKAAAVRLTTRLHVHTLAFQAIIVDRSAGWRHTRNAAAKAALTAYRTVCRSTIVNPESASLILDDSFSMGATTATPAAGTRMYLNTSEPVSCWTESLPSLSAVAGDVVEVEVCVAPVLVCRVARQTAGAGDNISAAGLILQI